jgi:hypothetical protein
VFDFGDIPPGEPNPYIIHGHGVSGNNRLSLRDKEDDPILRACPSPGAIRGITTTLPPPRPKDEEKKAKRRAAYQKLKEKKNGAGTSPVVD